MSHITRFSIRPPARVVAGLVGFGLVLGAVGCANPVDQLVSSVSEGAIKEITGAEEVNLPTDGSGTAQLPKNWPDIPTPSQAPMTSITTPDGMQAMFAGSEADFDQLLQEFEATGWAQESESNFGGQMRNHVFTRDNLSVNLSLVASDSEPEAIIQYLVFEDTAEG